MRSFKNLAYGPYRENILDLHLPEQDTFDLFMYIHGGGIESGDKGWDTHIFEYLAQKGISVASINYRLYPDAKYPDFVEDSAVAVAWLTKHIGEYGNCKRIFIGGSSAGGYLSMMLCFDGRWLGAHGLSAMDFAGFVHDAGQPTNHFNVLRERGIDTRRVIIDDSAPLYHIGVADAYPPMCFIVSDDDMENRYEQTQLVLSTLRHFRYDESKIQCREMHGTHCQYVSEKDENGDSILGKLIYDFIQAY